MLPYTKLEHRFVQYIPDRLEPGIIYISMEYATAAHNCCCGCGEQVITPFTPTDWKLTFDGKTVSLWPSIGNWNFKCRSHYIIRGSRVLSAEPWEDKRIENTRRRDKRQIENGYDEGNQPKPLPLNSTPDTKNLGLWDQLKKIYGRKTQ